VNITILRKNKWDLKLFLYFNSISNRKVFEKTTASYTNFVYLNLSSEKETKFLYFLVFCDIFQTDHVNFKKYAMLPVFCLAGLKTQSKKPCVWKHGQFFGGFSLVPVISDRWPKTVEEEHDFVYFLNF
jgi:hypothetical protein